MTGKWPWDYRRFLALNEGKKPTQAEREKIDGTINLNRALHALKKIGIPEKTIQKIKIEAASGNAGPAIRGALTEAQLGEYHSIVYARAQRAWAQYRVRKAKTKLRRRPRV